MKYEDATYNGEKINVITEIDDEFKDDFIMYEDDSLEDTVEINIEDIKDE